MIQDLSNSTRLDSDDFNLVVNYFVSLILSPLITSLAKRWRWADDLSRAVCVTIAVGCSVLVWVAFGADADGLISALVVGMAAGGTATAGVNVAKVTQRSVDAANEKSKSRSKRKRSTRKKVDTNE